MRFRGPAAGRRSLLDRKNGRLLPGNRRADDIIIVTEAGMLHRLKKEIPDKLFIPGPTEHCACAECRFMKMNTLEKAHAALRDLEPEIVLTEALRKRAELPIRRMLELSR